MSINKKGVLYSIAAACISGLSIFYAKQVVIKIDPIVFNILKNGGAALLFTAIIFLSSPNGFMSFLKRRWPQVLLISLIGGSIPFLLFFAGLSQIPASFGALIHKSLFIFVGIFSLIFLKEKIKNVQILGYFLIMGASMFLVKFPITLVSLPVILVFSATILWAIENILLHKFLKKENPLHFAWSRMFFGTIFIFLFALINGNAQKLILTSRGELLAVIPSIILLFSYVYLWTKALKYAKASLVTSILVLSIPITTALSSFYPQINISLLLVFQSVLLITGVLALTFPNVKKAANPEK